MCGFEISCAVRVPEPLAGFEKNDDISEPHV